MCVCANIHTLLSNPYMQQDGCDIFSNLSSGEYKAVLGFIRHDILATDLATFFPNQQRVARHLEDGTLDLEDETHL